MQTAGGVLVDTSVWSHAVVGETVFETLPGLENKLALIRAKKETTNPKLKREIECLPTIARLAREGVVLLYTYDELVNETMHKTGLLTHLFGGVKLCRAQAPVRRGLFSSNDLSEFIRPYSKSGKTGPLADFCEWLIKYYSDKLLSIPYIQGKLTDCEIENLRKIDILRSICKPPLDTNHFGDAFHLWAAEINNLQFLTTDSKFIRALSNTCHMKIRHKPILPSQLLHNMGIAERDPMPFKYGRRYTLNGQMYDEEEV